MAKPKKIINSLTFNIALATTVLLFIFGIIVATIGYVKFNDTLTERYNDAAYTTAISTRQFISGEDVEYYYTVGKAIYDAHGQELYNEYYAQYGDSLKKDKNIWKQYVSAVEEYLPNDAPEYRRDKYRSIKASLQEFCKNQDVAILYIVIPISDDYSYYCSVVDCVNSTYLPYNEWVLGENGESQKHPADSEYNAIYKNIMENGLERATVAVKKPSNGATPYINSLAPIYKGEGANKEIVGIIVVQQTMALLNRWGTSYTLLIVITTVILSVLSVTVYIWLVKSQFVTPIHKIMNEAQRFAKENSAPEQPIIEDVSRIHEISTLAVAINDMEEDTLKYINNLSDIIAEKQKIGTELGIAKNIQEAFVPNKFPAFPDRFDFDLYASMTTAKQVGGDFYDFFLVDDDHLAMVIADVSGKGIPAALFMMVTKILIYERTMLGYSPAEVLEFVNNRICANNSADMFVTVWLGFLELSSGNIIAANAGHDNPAVLKNGKFEFVKAKRGVVIGAIEDSKYSNFDIKLRKGDVIFLFTDGVPEATNVDNQMFTLDRTLAALNEMKDASPKEIIDKINTRLVAFTGAAPQFDDTTMLCVKYIGKDIAIDRELTVVADIDNLPNVHAFAESVFEEQLVPKKTAKQLLIAIEEVFANVAHYAYPPKCGDVVIHIYIKDNLMTITVKDKGTPYNPLEKDDPDISLSANERKEGGLGIYMTKKLVDKVVYNFVDGQNILTLEKNF